jgi:hypothetical protein
LRSALFCFLSTFWFSRFEQWFFGFLEKYGKIKITRGLFALGVGERAVFTWFHFLGHGIFLSMSNGLIRDPTLLFFFLNSRFFLLSQRPAKDYIRQDTTANPEALKKGLSDWQNLCFRG